MVREAPVHKSEKNILTQGYKRNLKMENKKKFGKFGAPNIIFSSVVSPPLKDFLSPG